MIPQAALRYIKNKKLAPAFSYKDIWNEEHATNFTVAKAMQLDVLNDIKGAVETSIADGQTLEQFRKNLKTTLMQKGWWGKKEMEDPLTGETVNAQLGSDRRLKTIYDTNLRSAYQEGRWERTQTSTAHPYLMYRVGNSKEHRKEHLDWNGLILPKDDPWWNSHFPPNGWGCKCWTMAVSEARKQRLEETGIKVPPSVDGEPGYTVRVKTQPPKTTYKTFVNERKGTVEHVPIGVDPAFNWNVGKLGRDVDALEMKINETSKTIIDEPTLIDKIKNISGIEKVSLSEIPKNVQEGLLDGYKAVLGRYPELQGEFKALNTLEWRKDFFASCNSETGAISLNKKYFSNIKTIATAYNKDVKNGGSPVGTDWKAVIVHEIGHRTNFILNTRYSGQIDKIEDYIQAQALKNLKLSSSDIPSELSDYAMDGPKEFLAEAFAEFIMMGNKARRLAKEVGRMIDLAMKGKLL